jgi:hypothetical protein
LLRLAVKRNYRFVQLNYPLVSNDRRYNAERVAACRLGVMTDKTQSEHNESSLPLKADVSGHPLTLPSGQQETCGGLNQGIASRSVSTMALLSWLALLPFAPYKRCFLSPFE